MIRRIWLIARQDFFTYLRRPMIWVWIVLVCLAYFGIASGNVKISTSGDSAIGGSKAFVNSEFENARLASAMTMIVHGFFVSVLFGMAVMHDFDSGIMPILHSSRLRLLEYLCGKFLGCTFIVLFALLAITLLSASFCSVTLFPERKEYFAPFVWGNYWNPLLKLVLPALLLIAAISFSLGTLTRKSVLVFVFPLALLVVCGFFLNEWSPLWLSPQMNHVLNCIDPFGSRWLNEVYFKVDRGVEFYNTQAMTMETGFFLSRLVMAGLGIVILAVTIPLFRRQLTGAKHGPLSAINEVSLGHQERMAQASLALQTGLSSLGMTQQRKVWWRDVLNIGWYELRELRSSPSLYIFVPLILIQAIGSAFFNEGAFNTPLLHTAGTLATLEMAILSLLGCLLMMFHTVESQLRERTRRLAPILYSTQVSSFSILLGKSLANVAIGVAIMAATFVACWVVLLIQGKTPFELRPFLLLWGLVLMPTYLFWSAFVTFALVSTRNRYTAYAIAGIALVGTLYLQLSGKMTWLWNWNAGNVIRWSDISVLEMDRTSLILNRVFVLGLTVLLFFAATMFFWRRGGDAVQIATRLSFWRMAGVALRSAAFVVLPLIVGVVLWQNVRHGFQGRANLNKETDYWRQNVETWKGVEPLSVDAVDVQMTLQPAEQSLNVNGLLRLTNDSKKKIDRFALTRGAHWKNVSWKFDGTKTSSSEKIPAAEELPTYVPEDRSGLCVFELPSPLEPGESTLLRYSFNGKYPDGSSKNGGGANEFILPSGVVLTSFSSAFFPTPGFAEGVGFEPNKEPEPKIYAKDFFEEQLKPFAGNGDHFHVRTTITGPTEFTFNGVGVKQSESENNGLRTVVWESDSPVSFFNVVGGKWKVHKTDQAEIYYSDKHPYNIEEISQALDAARIYYSRWFAPYPWKELKLSEFPSMASYAQGFATNITFSESIGFLTKEKPGADVAFMVAAHEAAHQWWGNILVPGKGPGGNILSEGMAHFSTGLLFEQIKGLRGRISFFETIEKQYNDRRSPDSERPMPEIDGSKDGDTTVTYDRGGWVFWMLLNEMGRDDCLLGLQSFVAKYSKKTDDYPVIQDFVSHMRPFAKNQESFDAFVNQWIFDKVVPEYKFGNVEKVADGEKWIVKGTVKNVGTGTTQLEICASTNDRWIENESNPDYKNARTTVTLGAGETKPFEIVCPFNPGQVIVDPDFLILQLNRKLAAHNF